ncbi:hypothetical protein ACPW7J_05995 [Ihubacter sp. rT4E-8]|uniref:hypothetical protein n=1 Tax=Ihubacter sp. rT4E-8 TaxID=3242369 RepID=UPI003CEE3D55
MREMGEKKKKILAFVGLVVFAGILVAVVTIHNLPEGSDRGMTRGGDEVLFNEPVSSGMLSPFEPYEAVDEKGYRKLEPKGEGVGSQAVLPENAANIEHKYRYALNEKYEKTQLHDEAWTWETPQYPDGRAAVSNVLGRQQDRGYVKMIQYIGQRPLGEEKLYSESVIDLRLRKSSVNGRLVWVIRDGRASSDPGRAMYIADITDAGGDDVNVYLEAENVSEDYFLNLLEIITGGPDMTDRISLVSSGTGDSLEDIEREKLLLEKDKEQQDRESKMARGAETILQDEWSEEFAAGYGPGDIKKWQAGNSFFVRDFVCFDTLQHQGEKAYNFKCTYEVIYPCARNDNNGYEGFSIMLTRYMQLEEDQNGVYVEKGIPYIEIDEDGMRKEIMESGTRIRYDSPSQCPYVAKVEKSKVKGKSREEISLLLLKKIVREMSDQGKETYKVSRGTTYQQTRDRTFLITEYKDPHIVRISKTSDKNKWIVKGDYSWKYVGYTDSYGYMGAAFAGYGRQGWIVRYDKDNRFVLQEKGDCYTMETVTNYELHK